MDANSEKRELRRLRWVFGTPYFVQGTSALSEIPTLFFIKFVLGMGDAGGQVFQSLKNIGWFIKPLWGFLSDHVPIFGYRRKSWFILMASLAFFFWVLNAALAFFGVVIPVVYLVTFSLALAAYAFVDVVTDAYMVEEGQRLGRVGSFVNFQWTMLALSAAIVSFASGWFQEHIQSGNLAYWMVFLLTGVFPLATVIVGLKNIKEERMERLRRKKIAWKRAPMLETLKKWLTVFNRFRRENRLMWFLVLFIFFWKFTPSVGFVQQSYLIDVREFSGSVFGIIAGIGGITFLLSIITYNWFAKTFPRIHWHHYLYAMIIIGVLSLPISFYAYLEPEHAWWKPLYFTLSDAWNPLPEWNRYMWLHLVANTVLGFATIPAFLIPLTIAGETVKRKSAGMSYAFLMALANVTNMFGGMVGAVLYGFFSIPGMSWILQWFRGATLDIAGNPDSRTLILQIFVYISLFFVILSAAFVYLLKKHIDKNGIQISLVAKSESAV